MEERYNATTQNRFYPDMSNVNKNITVEAELISPPTYLVRSRDHKVPGYVSMIFCSKKMNKLVVVAGVVVVV